jgi:pimeloyl-ACP methyl ester carboxylesterase
MMAKTVMFVHGMFLNPKSWQAWQSFFQQRGYDTIAPAWPLHAGDPRELRNNPPPGLGELSLDAVIGAMQQAAAPHEDLILIGHSVGGLIVQQLISRGLGSLGVPICSVAPNRMLSLDWGFFRNSVAITNPLKGDEPYPMDADGFYQNFGNAMKRAESDAAYEQFAMPESRNVLRDCLGESGEIELDEPHAPMLFVGADKDEIIPPELCERNARAYTDRYNRPAYVEFQARGHFICGQRGWEEVAIYIDQWIESKTGAAAATRRAV